jgi:hypothetical protein
MNPLDWHNKKYADITEHATIYRQVYWGQFVYDRNSPDYNHAEFTTIIRNRNSFINDYNINNKYNRRNISYFESYLRNGYSRRGYKIDHTESYETIDNRILIVNSPYAVSVEEEAMLVNDGWIKIYNIYAYNATTFIKTFDRNQFGTKYFTDANGRIAMI